MVAFPLPVADERRRHQRVSVSLLGRYMLESRREYPCQVVNMSPGGIALVAPVIGAPGERVVAYIDHIGRVEGRIVRHVPNGFAMTVMATMRKRDKLAAQLTWLANRHALDLPEDRRHERIVPKNPRSTMTLADGSTHPCRVIDMSLSGTAIATSVELELGLPITIGRMQGKVVRRLDGGYGIEFLNVQLPTAIEAEFGA